MTKRMKTAAIINRITDLSAKIGCLLRIIVLSLDGSEGGLLQIQPRLLVAFGFGLRRLLERLVQRGDIRQALDGVAAHQFFDCAQLYAWILLPVHPVLVEAGARRLDFHLLGRRLQRD